MELDSYFTKKETYKQLKSNGCFHKSWADYLRLFTNFVVNNDVQKIFSSYPTTTASQHRRKYGFATPHGSSWVWFKHQSIYAGMKFTQLQAYVSPQKTRSGNWISKKMLSCLTLLVVFYILATGLKYFWLILKYRLSQKGCKLLTTSLSQRWSYVLK